MELHSYAKRKALKKWTINQKRKLVDARIGNDILFCNKPTNSVVPWKKILSIAKLDDYNVFFVRKQWSNMVARYKQYKQSRLGDIPAVSIDDETVRKITEEWEFFAPIHRFMTRKTTNLHSYALTQSKPQILDDDDGNDISDDNNVDCASTKGVQQQQQDNIKRKQQHISTSSTERVDVFSSDTNEDYITTHNAIPMQTHNTDHDSYTKKSKISHLNYFADVSENTQESMMMAAEATTSNLDNNIANIKESTRMTTPTQMQQQPQQENEAHIIYADIKKEDISLPPSPQPQMSPPAPTPAPQCHRNAQESHLSERDKYYRHKRRFNRRIEQRLDSLLNVFGQIVKAEYPGIDVSPIMGTDAAAHRSFGNKFFSSNEDDSPDDFSANDELDNSHNNKQ